MGTAALQADYAVCRQVMQTASRNYTFASLALPRVRRPHVEALYAFLRIGDDRVDVSHRGFASPRHAIEDWETLYWQAFATGHSPHPVLRAYLATAKECHIPAEIMRAYFCAMKDDLTVTRYTTFADLLHYMDGSAIPVGRAMVYILGVQPPCTIATTLPYADSLSIAMQLCNFWRDVGEDWRRNRIYLPQEDMARFHITEADLAAGRITPHWRALLEFEFERTDIFYQHAAAGIQRLAAGRWGVLSSLRIYRAILASIRQQNYNVFTRRAGPTLSQKLYHLFHAQWGAGISPASQYDLS